MANKFILSVFTVGMSISTQLNAQELDNKPVAPSSPISVESMFGNTGAAYQLSFHKKTKSIPKLGFFTSSSVISDWEKSHYDGVMIQGMFAYKLVKGLDAIGGFHYSNPTGMRPTVGLLYTYSKKDFLLIAKPRVDLVKDAVTEGMFISEYKPAINGTWKLYTRVQGLYGMRVSSGDHARSYVYGRVGVSIKEFSFGYASNFDWFGATKGFQSNHGAFVTVALF